MQKPMPPVLIADTAISDNTSAPSNTEEPREEIQNYDNSVIDLDKEFISVLIIYKMQSLTHNMK